MDIETRSSIKKIAKEDASIIHQLAQTIWPKAFEHILTEEQINYMMQLMYSVPILEAEIARGVEFYVFNVKGEDLGYTAIEKKDNESWKLHKIYLHEKLRGKGVGKFQLRSMEKIVTGYSAQFLYLNVNRYNKAVDFYKSQGYEVVGSEDIDIGNGFLMNDFVMRKKIS